MQPNIANREHAHLTDDLFRIFLVVAVPQRAVLFEGRRLVGLVVHARSGVLARTEQGLAVLVAAGDDKQPVARDEPVFLALVDENHLILPVEDVRIDRSRDVCPELGRVTHRRNNLKTAPHRADESPALDHVERLGQSTARDPRLRIPFLDLHGTENGHHRPLGVPLERVLLRPKDAELIADGDVVIWLEVEVRVVTFAEKELIVGAPPSSPHTSFTSSSMYPCSRKNTVVGGTVIWRPTKRPFLSGGCRFSGGGAARWEQFDLAPWINPVRVLQVGVVAPHARPIPRVVIIAIANLPERLASLDDVNGRDHLRGRVDVSARERGVGVAPVRSPILRSWAPDRIHRWGGWCRGWAASSKGGGY